MINENNQLKSLLVIIILSRGIAIREADIITKKSNTLNYQ